MSWFISHFNGRYHALVQDESVNPISCINLEQAEAKCNYLNGGDGLTKRELFAMAAMQALIANCNVPESQIASWSVSQADALIAELEKKS